MRFLPVLIALSATLLLGINGCVPVPGAPGPAALSSARPDVVIVRAFAVPEGVVVLDPSFGFSLRRGTPGVPQRKRAASVGRAVAFRTADTTTEALRRLGFDVVRSDTVPLDPGRSTLVIGGVFRRIDQGQRRRAGGAPSIVAAEAQIDYRSPGAGPQPLLTLHLDSARPPPSGTAPRHADVNADAARIGRLLASAIADLARRENWLATAR